MHPDAPSTPSEATALHNLHDFFLAVTRAPEFLEQLKAAERHSMTDRRKIPETPGIYLLSEGNQPLYVGQSRNLRRRLTQHQRAAGLSNEATFAFAMAVRDARDSGRAIDGRTRAELSADPDFAQRFKVARDRVGHMEAQIVEVRDPIARTLFEVYAALALGTANDFETH